MGPLLWVIGSAVAGFVGYEAFKKKPRFVGDLAQAGATIATADQVEVPTAALIASNSSISVGTGAGQLPDGTNSVIIAVLGATADQLQGPITTLGTIPVPTPIGSVTVNRADVTTVYRNGKKATAATLNPGLTGSQFNGEQARRNTFAG